MKSIYNLILLLIAFLPVISSRHEQFFRKDYIYVAQFDAFYKLHWDLHGISWSSAFLACDDEEATLFYPKSKDEWTLAKNLTRDRSESPNVTDVFVGLHDEFGLGEFMTVDGHSTSSPLSTINALYDFGKPAETQCVLMDIETGLYKSEPCTHYDEPIPFICKKVDDESCPTIDPGYKYVKSSKKCYKINKKPKMWDEAMRTCYMEGGTLVVLENNEQAEAIKDKLDRNLKYFVGIRKMFSLGNYYTVKGQRFENVYQWSNGYSRYEHNCGAIYVDSQIGTTTEDCGSRLPFICEMEV